MLQLVRHWSGDAALDRALQRLPADLAEAAGRPLRRKTLRMPAANAGGKEVVTIFFPKLQGAEPRRVNYSLNSVEKNLHQHADYVIKYLSKYEIT